MPLGTFIGYDYAQPPQRYFEPFLYTPKEEGFIFEATWVNNGPSFVNWGLTSDDEMFVMGIYYVYDTTGLYTGVSKPKIVEENKVHLYPNPFSEQTLVKVNFSTESGTADFVLYDLLGKELLRKRVKSATEFVLHRESLPAGVYIYHLIDGSSTPSTGKLVAY